jgi:hydrogenase/urease accessory protein HupE
MPPERRHYAVLFGASMGLLMLELSFARTLSVALLSHYAFFVGAQAGFTWALLLGSATYALGFLVLTLAVSTRRIAAPERMRFAGER